MRWPSVVSVVCLVACATPSGGKDSAVLPSITTTCPDAGAPPDVGEGGLRTSGIPAAGLVVAGGAGDITYVGSHSSGLWRSLRPGTPWRELRTRVMHEYGDLAVDPSDGRRIVHSSGGTLERSADAGETWTTLPFGGVSATPQEGTGLVFAVARAPYDPRELWAVTHLGHVGISRDEGDTWVEDPGLPTPPYREGGGAIRWRVLPPASPGGAALVAYDHGIWRRDPATGTWSGVLGDPVEGSSMVRDPRDASHILAGAWQSRDDGQTWTRRGGPAFVALSVDAGGTTWAGVDDSRLWTSTDGVGFTARQADVGQPRGVSFVGDRLVVTGTAGVATSQDGGVSWVADDTDVIDVGIAIVEADPICPGVVWAASRCGGGVFVSEDWGRSWTHVEGPHHYVMDLVLPDDPEAPAWIVSDDKLWRGDAARRTFERVTRGYHYHGFAVDPSDPSRLLLGSVGSGQYADTKATIYRSEDAGRSWNATSGYPTTPSSAHAIAWLGPDTVLAGFFKGGTIAHENGHGIGLWRSEDGGRTWSDTGLPARDVASIVHRDGTTWIATEQGLQRSEDDGRSWRVVRAADTLAVAVHGDDVLTLDRDGAVAVSNDDGGTWRVVANGPGGVAASDIAQVAIDAGGAIGWVTLFRYGVWAVPLRP
jgi:hypothetical protein